MTIPFHCPECNAYTEVQDQFAGQTGPCATCGKTITIPQLPSVANRAKDSLDRFQKRNRLRIAGLVTLAFAAIVVLGLFLYGSLIAAYFVPSVITIADSPHQTCQSQMQQLAAAMLAYEESHGTLPPSYQADEKGTPLHSWRVLVLPYLGYDSLYKRFHLDEPWDSEHNKKLIVEMPPVFGCPADKAGQGFGEPSYMVISGSGLVFDKDQTTKSTDIPDGPANTILLVEVADSQVPWTQPVDVHAARISWSLNRDPQGIGSHHRQGVNVVMVDGTVYSFSEILPADQFRAMATKDGGESVEPASWSE